MRRFQKFAESIKKSYPKCLHTLKFSLFDDFSNFREAPCHRLNTVET